MLDTNLKFGVRPYPSYNESITGYILRLCELNGIDDVKSLVKTIGIKLPFNKFSEQLSYQIKSNLCSRISLLLGHDENYLNSNFFNDKRYYGFNDFDYIKNIRLDFLRICPICIKNNNLIENQWMLAPVSHCTKHMCKLVDNCPKCNKALIYKSSLFEGCEHCGFLWDNYMPSYCKISNYELKVHDLFQGLTKNDELLEDLCLAICALSRPFDSLIQPINAVKYILNYSDLVDDAYQIIQNKSAIEQWVSNCKVQRLHHSYDFNRAVDLPVKIFMNKLKYVDSYKMIVDESFNFNTLTKHENILSIRNYRKNLSSNEEDFRYHVTFKEVALILNIDSSDVSNLICTKKIRALNSTNVIRDQIFDIRSILSLINSYKIDSDKKDKLYKITKNNKAFNFYLCKFTQLLCAIFNDEISGFTDVEDDELVIFVNFEDFKHWVLTSLETTCQSSLSISNSKKLLRCNESKIKEYINSTKLKLVSSTISSNDRIDGPMLYRLFIDLNLPFKAST